MINIRYPNITGRTAEEKLSQMESFLRQMVDQVNFALMQLEQSGSAAQTNNTQGR